MRGLARSGIRADGSVIECEWGESNTVSSPLPFVPHRGVGPARAWEPPFTMRKEGLGE